MLSKSVQEARELNRRSPFKKPATPRSSPYASARAHRRNPANASGARRTLAYKPDHETAAEETTTRMGSMRVNNEDENIKLENIKLENIKLENIKLENIRRYNNINTYTNKPTLDHNVQVVDLTNSPPPHPSSMKPRHSTTSSNMPNILSHEIAFADLKINGVLGKGSFGEVKHGMFGRTPVAIKFCLSKEAIYQQKFIQEAELMCKLPPGDT